MDEPTTYPPLPEIQEIPQELVMRWVRVHPDAPLTEPLLARELDHLFFAFNSMIQAHVRLGNAMQKVSAMDIKAANEEYFASKQQLINASNQMITFMQSLMARNEPHMAKLPEAPPNE